jgi:hypothetical protein
MAVFGIGIAHANSPTFQKLGFRSGPRNSRPIKDGT